MSDTIVQYYWAPWCTSCVTVGPMLEKLCAERGVTLEKFDADVHPLPDALINYTSLPVVQIKSKTVNLAFAGAAVTARTMGDYIR